MARGSVTLSVSPGQLFGNFLSAQKVTPRRVRRADCQYVPSTVQIVTAPGPARYRRQYRTLCVVGRADSQCVPGAVRFAPSPRPARYRYAPQRPIDYYPASPRVAYPHCGSSGSGQERLSPHRLRIVRGDLPLLSKIPDVPFQSYRDSAAVLLLHLLPEPLDTGFLFQSVHLRLQSLHLL